MANAPCYAHHPDNPEIRCQREPGHSGPHVYPNHGNGGWLVWPAFDMAGVLGVLEDARRRWPDQGELLDFLVARVRGLE